jgi:hypothetical protein
MMIMQLHNYLSHIHHVRVRVRVRLDETTHVAIRGCEPNLVLTAR